MHFVCLNELHPVPAWVCSLRFHEVSSWWIHKSELQLSPCFFHIKKHSTSFSYWWMVEINRPVPAHHLGVTELPPRLRESFLMRSDLSETNGWFTVQQTKKELFQNGKHHSTSYPERFFSLCLSEISAIDVKSRDSKAQISLKWGVREWGWHPSLGAFRGCAQHQSCSCWEVISRHFLTEAFKVQKSYLEDHGGMVLSLAYSLLS